MLVLPGAWKGGSSFPVWEGLAGVGVVAGAIKKRESEVRAEGKANPAMWCTLGRGSGKITCHLHVLISDQTICNIFLYCAKSNIILEF